MHWIVFALGAALSWGLYGPSLHAGQTKLGSPFRALLCVGIAYFIVGATGAGMLGALGAVFIIYAFRAGGLPTYVMPLVFGGAPLVNVAVTMYLHPPKETPNPLLYLGFVLVAVGASLVLYFKPQG